MGFADTTPCPGPSHAHHTPTHCWAFILWETHHWYESIFVLLYQVLTFINHLSDSAGIFYVHSYLFYKPRNSSMASNVDSANPSAMYGAYWVFLGYEDERRRSNRDKE